MFEFQWPQDAAIGRMQDEYDSLRNEAQAGTLRRLNQSECISTFAKDFVQTASAVVLVTKDPVEGRKSVLNSYTPLATALYQVAPYAWMCHGSIACDISQYTSHGIWNVDTYPIDFCLVADADEKCSIELR